MTDQPPNVTLSDRFAALTPRAQESLLNILSHMEEDQEDKASSVAQAILAYYPIIDDPSDNECLAWIVFAWLVVNGLLPVPDIGEDSKNYFPMALAIIVELLDFLDQKAQ
jgi:hypothetical protein